MRRASIILLLALSSPARAEQTTGEVLTLESALARARRLNPTVHAAVAMEAAADAREDRARAALLPQLVGSASYQRTTGNFIPRPGAIPSSASTTPTRDASWRLYNFYNFGVTASVLLYDFQGSIDRLRGARETRKAFEERTRAAELAVDFAVRDAFFQARTQRELVSVAREALANNQRHVEQTQAFVEVGTRPEIDLAQVRTDLANARVALVRAENAHAIAKANLQRAMGVEETVAFEVADEQLGQLADEGASLEQLLKQALAARPDVLALTRELSASELTASASQGAFGPALSASTTFSEGGTQLDNLRFNWNAGVQLNWPLVRGGATIAEVREARANARRAAASLSEVRQTVRLQIEQARLGIGAALAVRDASQEALANARARLGYAEGRYEAGVGNAIELGDAQLALTQAAAQSVSAEYSLSMARAQLLNALGRSR